VSAGRLAATFVVLAALVTGCSGDDGAAPGPGDLDVPPVDGAAVRMVDLDFTPAAVSVVAGETVVFTNDDDDDHTVTADEGEFDSGAQLPGETFRFLTDETTPAQIGYHCELHPEEMRGTISVVTAEQVEDG